MLNFALPFLAPVLSILKKIGWKGWLVIGIAAGSFYLYQWVDRLQERNEELEWLIAAKEAETETLKVIAEYSVVETVLVSRIRVVYDTTEGQVTVDTVYEDIPSIYGSIKVDTTKEFGPKFSLMSIRVVGEFWYPPEYSHRNWMLIHPVIGPKTPFKPVTARYRGKWGLGLIYSRSLRGDSGTDYAGISARYQRLSLAVSYDPWGKAYLGTISYEFLTF